MGQGNDMAWFIFGAICGIAVCIPVIIISRRNGGDIKGRIGESIQREGTLQDTLRETASELSSDIGSARDRTSERFDEAGKQIRSEDSIDVNRVRDTDGIIDDIKKRNKME
jgi:hypothetical protein